MISKTIEYIDFDGKEQKRDFWFHLTKLEVAEINLGDDLEAVANSGNPVRALKALKRILRYAVAERNGNAAFKSETLGDEFVASDAYSELIFGIMNEEDNGLKTMEKFIREMAPFIAIEEKKLDHLPKSDSKEA